LSGSGKAAQTAARPPAPAQPVKPRSKVTRPTGPTWAREWAARAAAQLGVELAPV